MLEGEGVVVGGVETSTVELDTGEEEGGVEAYADEGGGVLTLVVDSEVAGGGILTLEGDSEIVVGGVETVVELNETGGVETYADEGGGVLVVSTLEVDSQVEVEVQETSGPQ